MIKQKLFFNHLFVHISSGPPNQSDEWPVEAMAIRKVVLFLGALVLGLSLSLS